MFLSQLLCDELVTNQIILLILGVDVRVCPEEKSDLIKT